MPAQFRALGAQAYWFLGEYDLGFHGIIEDARHACDMDRSDTAKTPSERYNIDRHEEDRISRRIGCWDNGEWRIYETEEGVNIE